MDDDTPFIHVGDFNFVGYRQQVETIRIGDIEDENKYGIDFLPDWDSTGIVDLYSRHTHKRMGYTWRSDGSSFNPGKLDYVFYSDATIDSGRHFILNTLAMGPDALNEYGLEWDDTQEASDHLPIIFDISMGPNVGIDNDYNFLIESAILSNYPNPFNPNTIISVSVGEKRHEISLHIYDIQGRLIQTLDDGYSSTRIKKYYWNGSNYPGGIYFLKLKAGDYAKTRKMILLK